MCGRFSLTATPGDLADIFKLDDVDDFPPRYNIAPTQPILMIVNGAPGRRTSTLVRWGLVPAWVKDPSEFTLLLNARSETAAEKPSFRTAMRHRRTLVPASGFYEWHRPADKSQPKQAYWIKPKRDNGVVCFGGLMETWCDANGSEIDTGCILTTSANRQIGTIHHRMPVVIRPQDFERWLDCRTAEPRDVIDLMQPVADNFFEVIAISDKVNKVANSGSDIQEPVPPLSRNIQQAGKDMSRAENPKFEGQFDLFQSGSKVC